MSRFVQWYNSEHLHSAIRFVTPSSRHGGQDTTILAKRTAVYEQAKRKYPLRWSGSTRNWSPITEVFLNPKKHPSEIHEEFSSVALPTPSKTSLIGDLCTSISDSDNVGVKNDFHNCPVTNASELGKGLPRVKNRQSDHRLRSPLPQIVLLAEKQRPIIQRQKISAEQSMRHLS